MLRLDQLYFRNYFVLFFLTLFVVSVSGYFLLQKIEINNHKTMLENMIDEYHLMQKYLKDPSPLIKEIKKETGVRVTIINLKGVVLFESNRDTKGMQNHLNRPEIQEALKNRIGQAVRYSVSVKRNFLYVAKKYNENFIRMAYALESINEKFLRFWIKAILLFSLAMALAFWIAIKINRKISVDLKNIELSLKNLLNKNYKTVFNKTSCCKEFETIAKQIAKVSAKLEKREKQKAKYTKNLKILSKKQSDIISAISHEFKNPVAAIIGYTQSVKEDDKLSGEIRERFLNKTINNAYKISNMIDRLSLAIKLENENFAPTFSEFSLYALIEDIKENLLQKYKNREIVIEVEDLKLRADRAMFDTLLTNLIENALKYSEDEVIVRLEGADLQIIDKGIGITEENLKNITKRFFRVDSLSWDNSIGVGLYIVKYILKLHNINLHIQSAPNEGSKFWFEIDKLMI